MAKEDLHGLVRYMHRMLAAQGAGVLSDAQLLERFLSQRDEMAFEVLVWRHGPMVLRLCRRLLGHAQNAEDAFQATFLMLVRKAGSIRKGQALGSWLYKVAHRIALEAKTRASKRATAEKHATYYSTAEATGSFSGTVVEQETRAVLDEAVCGLPEKYRAAVVLCYFQGKTHQEAAQQLGCPKATVSIRLMRARELLRSRLARRGVALSAAALANLLSESAAPAAVPSLLTNFTIKAAMWFAAGKAVSAGVVSERAVILTEGVLKAMFLTKAKATTAVLLAILGIGMALWAYRPATAELPGRQAEDGLKLAAREGDEPKVSPKERQVQRPLGHWEREVGPYHVSLRIEADRLFGTFIGTDNNEKITVAIESDYSVTKDSVLYGIVTGVEMPGNAEVELKANEFLDQPFSVHFRMDDNTLTLKNLKHLLGNGNGKSGELDVLQGRYKKKSSESSVQSRR
jgi:RNA polymerase sigma factor (sigma-70 family)